MITEQERCCNHLHFLFSIFKPAGSMLMNIVVVIVVVVVVTV